MKNHGNDLIFSQICLFQSFQSLSDISTYLITLMKSTQPQTLLSYKINSQNHLDKFFLFVVLDNSVQCSVSLQLLTLSWKGFIVCHPLISARQQIILDSFDETTGMTQLIIQSAFHSALSDWRNKAVNLNRDKRTACDCHLWQLLWQIWPETFTEMK